MKRFKFHQNQIKIMYPKMKLQIKFGLIPHGGKRQTESGIKLEFVAFKPLDTIAL